MPCAIAAAVSAEPRRDGSGCRQRPRAARALHDCRRPRRRLRTTARAGHRREPRSHEPAGATLGCCNRKPAAPGPDPARAPRRDARRRRTAPAELLGQRPLEGVRMALRTRPDDEVDLYLEVMRADRDLDALALSPARSTTRATADSGSPKNRRIAVVGRCRLQHALNAAVFDRPRPQPLELPRRSGEHNHDAPSTSETRPGAVPARPSDSAPSGIVACLRTPCSNSSYGRRTARRSPRTTAPISRSRAGSTTSSRPATRARSRRFGRRASARARRRSRRAPAPSDSRNAASSPSGRSPTTRYAFRLDPGRLSSRARNGPFSSVPAAADELAPRDEDDRCRCSSGRANRNHTPCSDHDRRRVAASGAPPRHARSP